MNKTDIEWCQYTWNPVTGCLHGCEYCYARGIAKRFGKNLEDDGRQYIARPKETYPFGFTPTFYPHRLEEPAKLREPAHIFTVSMGDLFGEWVPEEWITEVFQIMERCPQHTFTILTKNPQRVAEDKDKWYLPNVWIGTSITGKMDEEEVLRIHAMGKIWEDWLNNTVLSIEPYLVEISNLPKVLTPFDWIIVGGLTGRKKFQPPAEWVWAIFDYANAALNSPVFVKDNAGLPGLLKQYPEGIPHG